MPNSNAFAKQHQPRDDYATHSITYFSGLLRKQRTFDTGSKRVSMFGTNVSLKVGKRLLAIASFSPCPPGPHTV